MLGHLGGWIPVLLVVAATGFPVSGQAQGFMGTVQVRVIRVRGPALTELLGAPGSEDAERAFALNAGQMLAAARRGRPGVRVQATTYRVKGTRLRVETNAGYLLLDLDRESVRMVNPRARSFRTRRPPPPREGDRRLPPALSVGREQEVNHVPSTAYDMRWPGRIVRGWVTEEYRDLWGSLQALAPLGAPTATGAFGADFDGITVRTQSYDFASRTLLVQDLVAIVPESLPDSIFEVPSGFRDRGREPPP